jgi:hemerythrin
MLSYYLYRQVTGYRTMALIKWRKEFETGIPGIDYEHQELVALINSFYAALINNTDKSKLIDSLNDIYGAIYAHFMLEENMMEKYGYDQYEQHRDDHVNLLDDIRDITDKLEASEDFSEDQLKTRLNDWFSIHFKTHDARLHQLEELIASGKADKGTVSSFFKNAKNTLFGKD